MRKLLVLLPLLYFAGQSYAHANYTGYSGAPGRGTCAGSCHGSSGNAVTIMNFPSVYAPSQTYAITIKKLSGSSICNFNGSCRIGSGTTNAGTLSAGTGTATYNVSGETNGIHLSSNNRDSAIFNWTAPAAGTGVVTLYVAAYQGTSASGANTTLSLASSEASAVPGDMPLQPEEISLACPYPNPFNASVSIFFELPRAMNARLAIFDVLGRQVAILADGQIAAGSHEIVWTPNDLSSGIYFVRLAAETNATMTKIVLLK
jgi:hypothetical protein